jgi:alkanesulfonate monooxygenase SsuD/methylene tetrahydromethanopterin reductase-like flavin-dependent oxidoreductase (luciferase family)
VQPRVPILIGGFGRRVIGIAARHADIAQFTGLVDLPDGSMSIADFALDAVVERAAWLAAAAGERDDAIERSALVQLVRVGGDVPSSADLARQFDVDEAVVADSPFVLAGSLDQLVDKLERIRAATGISHYVIRDADAFAPVAAALRGN